jgi:hypothetical protein
MQTLINFTRSPKAERYKDNNNTYFNTSRLYLETTANLIDRGIVENFCDEDATIEYVVLNPFNSVLFSPNAVVAIAIVFFI